MKRKHAKSLIRVFFCVLAGILLIPFGFLAYLAFGFWSMTYPKIQEDRLAASAELPLPADHPDMQRIEELLARDADTGDRENKRIRRLQLDINGDGREDGIEVMGGIAIRLSNSIRRPMINMSDMQGAGIADVDGDGRLDAVFREWNREDKEGAIHWMAMTPAIKGISAGPAGAE